MKEAQSQHSEQLVQRRSKVDSALDRIYKLVSTPSSITNNNLRQTVEEAAILPQQDRLANIIAVGERRKEIHRTLQEKTEPYLKSLGFKINDEILEREIKEESALREHQQIIEPDSTAIKLDMPSPLLDEREVFALASIWASNPRLAAEYGVEPLPQQVVLNLKSLIGEEFSPTQQQQKEIAAAVLKKILEVVNSDKLDQVYDSQPPPVQDLLLHFTTIDPESVVNFLNKALSECDETVQPTTLAEPIVDKMTEIPKYKEIERRDPQVRQTVRGTLDRIEAHRINKPVSTVQLVKFFPNLKAKFVTQIEEDKRYITPERGRDGRHPVFNREEITFLLYVREHGNNLTPRLVKDLKDIIDEEVSKRSQNNGNKNGASKDQPDQRITIEQPPEPRVNGSKPVSSSEKQRAEDEVQIPEQDLTAINLYIENPQIALSEVIAVLGEGETLIPDQIQSRLTETASKLYERNTQGAASQAEIDVWEKIKNKTKMGENKDALREFRSAVKAWFQREKRVEDQASSIIKVEEVVGEKTEELDAGITETKQTINAPPLETEQVLPIKIILEPTANKGPIGRGIGRYLNRFRGTSSRDHRTREVIQSIFSVLDDEIQENNKGVYFIRVKDVLHERPDVELTTLDKEYPLVRTEINVYFEILDIIKIWPANPQQFNQTGHGLNRQFMSSLIAKGIIPNNRLEVHPTITKSDAAIAFFAFHHDINLTKTHIEDLRQIIKEEEEYRNKPQKSSELNVTPE